MQVLQRNSAAMMSSPRNSFKTQKFGDQFVFQQDGALSHRAKSNVEFLQRAVSNFIEPSVCPLSATAWTWTRLTSLYEGCAAQRVSHSDFQFGWSQGQSAHLLGESWLTSTSQWRDRLKAVVRVNCGHIEHIWWTHFDYLVHLLLCSVVQRMRF